MSLWTKDVIADQHYEYSDIMGFEMELAVQKASHYSVATLTEFIQ